MKLIKKNIYIFIFLYSLSINSFCQNVPQNGWWWNPSESGRGFAIERQGSSIFMAAFLYEDNGEPTWYASLLNESADGSYNGNLMKYSGGKSLFGNYKPPTSQTVIATVNLNFPIATKGKLSIKSSSDALEKVIDLERFPISSPVGFNPSESYFQSGWWWNPKESGTGYFFEVQGDKVFSASFMYDTNGNPTWYTTYANLFTDATLNGKIDQYKGGQSLYGSYKKPYISNASNITGQYKFNFPDNGSFIPSNGKSVDIIRFIFENESPSKTYSDTLLNIDINNIAGEYSLTQPSNVSGVHGNLLLPNGREGVIISGWTHQNTADSPNIPNGIMILEQDKSGLMKSSASYYIPSDKINGSQSVLIADFNSDGQQDIFLPSFNEAHKRGLNSTLYISNNLGKYDKEILNDHVLAHGASLKYLKGIPTVFLSTYPSDIGPYDNNKVYQYISGKMKPIGQFNESYGSMSVAIADFNGDNILDAVSGGTYIYDYNKAFSNDYFTVQPKIEPIAKIEPYFSSNELYRNYTSEFGKGVTHTYRVWAEDFNHDGMMDILSGQSMWSFLSNSFPSVLQMNMNLGDFAFKDMTDILNPMKLEMEEIDYTMQIRDIDESGINSFLLSSKTITPSRNANYLLLNDGTGRLHVALHDEFIELSKLIMSSLSWNGKWLGDHYGKYWTGTSWQSATIEKLNIPNFLSYLRNNQCINYVAYGYNYYLNIPLNFCAGRDYKKTISIKNRNYSKRIRTFAGNDTIFDFGSNYSASIDGGLGIDTLVYSDVYANYEIKKMTQSLQSGTKYLEQLIQ